MYRQSCQRKSYTTTRLERTGDVGRFLLQGLFAAAQPERWAALGYRLGQ
jgi:hypothetical protein